MRITSITSRLENTEALDRPASWLHTLVEHTPNGQVRDTLHGVPLGHPAHPALVQVPLGAWVSASVLDCVPRTGPASGALIAVGLGAAVPAAAAGAVDLADTMGPQRRVGVVHAVCNTLALGMYSASLVARLRRRPIAGRLWALGGLTAISAGGFLGAHLAYRLGVGANHAEQVPRVIGDDAWHTVGNLRDLPDGQPVRRMLGETALLVVRRGTGVDVLADRCSHLAGPLSEGSIADGCVRCPWHGSTFRLADGDVVHGPATAPQPVLETTLDGDRVMVRRPRTL